MGRDVVALICSLRAESWNRRVMALAAATAPASLGIDLVGIEGVPPYDEDLEADRPAAVVALDARLRRADAVLVAVPEYNLGLAGVAKNALDWMSRPVLEGPFLFTPCGVVSISTSRAEPERAAAQAHTTLEACGATVMPGALTVRSIARRVDEDGRFTEAVTAPLAEFLGRFDEFVAGLGPASR